MARRRSSGSSTTSAEVGCRGCPGTAVFLFKDVGAAPPALITNLRHNKVLHERVILLSILTDDVPRVEPTPSASEVAPSSATACSR